MKYEIEMCSSQSPRQGQTDKCTQDFLLSDANGGSSPGGCRAEIDVSDTADNVEVSGQARPGSKTISIRCSDCGFNEEQGGGGVSSLTS